MSRRNQFVLRLLPLLVTSLVPAWSSAAAGGAPLSVVPYLGVEVFADERGRALVKQVLAGPLEGSGITSPTLCRPDLIVAVNGQAVDATSFRKLLAAARPGERWRISYRRSTQRGWGMALPAVHDEAVEDVEVELGSAAQWLAGLGRGTPPWSVPRVSFPLPHTLDPVGSLAGVLVASGADRSLVRLADALRSQLAVKSDPLALSAPAAALVDPLSLPERLAWLRPLRGEAPAEITRRLLAHGWERGFSATAPAPAEEAPDLARLPARLMAKLAAAGLLLERALAPLAPLAESQRDALALAAVPTTTYLLEGREAPPLLRLIQKVARVDDEALAAAFVSLLPVLSWEPPAAALAPGELPPELVGQIEGEVLLAHHLPSAGWVVIGAAGDNRYRLDRLAAVWDVGGNDVYETTTTPAPGRIRLLVDQRGNDRYHSAVEAGIGGALLGITLLDDREGNDLYQGAALSHGAALLGVALLVDRAGRDLYTAGPWSLGAGFYGAGLLLDLGSEDDGYSCPRYCQGLGGPHGFGALLEQGGRETYRGLVTGPASELASSVYKGFTQGAGFGFRFYTAGGFGLLADLAGDDRYEAEESSQGMGYHQALGVLADAAGDDLYLGGAHCQGSGAELGAGALIDDAGNDSYLAPFIGSQGSGWRAGVGLLLEREGDDHYRAGTLSQGSGGNSAAGWLLDLAGRDSFAAGGTHQGESGASPGMGSEMGVPAFSLFADLGAADDHYLSRRENGSCRLSAAVDEVGSLAGVLAGVFFDQGAAPRDCAWAATGGATR